MGSVTRSLLATVACTAAALACGAASASEDYTLRYAPGTGGADMSAPFESGWVFQAPAYAYSGKVTSTTPAVTDLTAPPFGVPIAGATATTRVTTRLQTDIRAVLPRLSYMGSATFLGATLGGTALLPLVHKRAQVSVRGVSTSVDAPALPDTSQAAIVSAIDPLAAANAATLAAANSNSATGIGDLELSPILRWSTEASQTLFVATVIAPTGPFHAGRAANPGAGHFWTFRPAVQYSFIGDGWDIGSRAAFSVNARDTRTHYRTGDYLNLDATLMKSLSDSLRAGLAGYAVLQTTRDTRPSAPADAALDAREEVTLDRKGRVYGLGPEVAYIHGAGEYLLDGRLVKEFSAVDRPEGTALWVTLSRPF